jgi:hypothetical protein
MPQLFIFGDSITSGAWDPDGGGWAQRLRKDIEYYQVANRDVNPSVHPNCIQLLKAQEMSIRRGEAPIGGERGGSPLAQAPSGEIGGR